MEERIIYRDYFMYKFFSFFSIIILGLSVFFMINENLSVFYSITAFIIGIIGIGFSYRGKIKSKAIKLNETGIVLYGENNKRFFKWDEIDRISVKYGKYTHNKKTGEITFYESTTEEKEDYFIYMIFVPKSKHFKIIDENVKIYKKNMFFILVHFLYEFAIDEELVIDYIKKYNKDIKIEDRVGILKEPYKA